MKRNIINILYAILTIACFTSCAYTISDSGVVPSSDSPVVGDGNVVTREIPIKNYNILIADRNVEVHYTQKSGAPYLKITADANIIKALNPRVLDNHLILSTRWPCLEKNTSPSIVPTKCVVETNSKKLIGFGTNICEQGCLSYALRNYDNFNWKREYVFKDFNSSLDSNDIKDTTQTILPFGAVVNVQKINKKVKLDVVYDRPAWTQLTFRTWIDVPDNGDCEDNLAYIYYLGINKGLLSRNDEVLSTCYCIPSKSSQIAHIVKGDPLSDRYFCPKHYGILNHGKPCTCPKQITWKINADGDSIAIPAHTGWVGGYREAANFQSYLFEESFRNVISQD